MRAGLRALLQDEPTIEVVGEAENGERAIFLTMDLLPDILLLDIGLPDIDGIQVALRLKKLTPQVQILILSTYEDESLLREAIQAGASGYLIKRAAEEELIAAIKSVSRGEMYIHPAITRLLLKDLSPSKPSREASVDLLTPREIEVASYLIKGFTNRQIAETLTISERTVEGHRASLLGKLGMKNRVELIEFAERNGLKSKWNK
jgi:two-component system response regulator NreC